MFECNCGRIFEKQTSRIVHRRYCKEFQEIKNHENKLKIEIMQKCPVCHKIAPKLMKHLESMNDNLHTNFLNEQKNIAKIIFEKGLSEYQRKEEGFIFCQRILWRIWREIYDESTIKNKRKINKYKKKTFICKKCNEKFNARQTLGICESCLTIKHKKYQCLACGKSIWKTKYGYCAKHYTLSEEYHKNMSKALKGNAGGYRKGGGRSKGGYYKGFYFDSQFEIEVARFFDENNVNWIRNTKRFYFNWEGKKTYYIPDFYFPCIDMYLETKGYYYKDKKIRTIAAVNENNIKWIEMMQRNWQNNKNELLKVISQHER